MAISREREIGSDSAPVGQFSFLKDGEVSLDKIITHAIDEKGRAEKIETWVKKKASEIPAIPKGYSSPEITDQGMKVLKERRYLENGETPAEMFWRVAYNIGMADWLYGDKPKETIEEFYQMLAGLEFIPNSPTMMNAGRKLQQLSACFVFPVEDDMSSIMDAVKATALIHQSGGGTGFSFSKIRPEGSLVSSSGGQASGPLSFMEIFNTTTEQIKQGGRRRGANMAVLQVDHPDIEKFIEAKTKPGAFENFNFSVAATDEFMKAVKEDGEYEMVNPYTKERKKAKARTIFEKICLLAWESGEPGMVFIDEINRQNPTKHLGRIESTNPCGEQPLHPYESCNLGSINLAKIVKDKEIDWEKLEQVTKAAVHFLDNVIDINRYPLPEIEGITKANRRTGLGIMGFADMLVQLEIAYDSQEGMEVAERIMGFIRQKAYEASEELAEKRGVFPNWEGSEHQKKGRKVRNATLTTIAPTGSIGIIAGCSQGCEPYYGLSFERRGLLDGETTIYELNPYVEQIAGEEGLDEAVIERIKREGCLKHIPEVPERMKKIFPTAYEMSPEWHVKMQAAFQRHTDNAVSKTINFSQEATVEEIRQAYLLAWELDCKGLTVYRDRSRPKQVLYKGEERKVGVLEPRRRPEITKGLTKKIEMGCGQTMYLTMNEDEIGLCETFVQMGKSGGCLASQNEAIGRLVSLALRSGVETRAIVKQLRGIRCPSPAWFKEGRILSCADVIGQALAKYEGLEENELPETRSSIEMPPLIGKEFSSKNEFGGCPECPDCGAMLEFSEGCIRCPACAYNQCE